MVKPSDYLICHVWVLGWRLQEHFIGWFAFPFPGPQPPTSPFHTVRCLGLPDFRPWQLAY